MPRLLAADYESFNPIMIEEFPGKVVTATLRLQRESDS